MSGNKKKHPTIPDEEIDRLYQILGKDVVLLPVPSGTKGPTLKSWQKTTLATSRTPAHRRKLQAQGNIAVLLGEVSGGLYSVDIDDDDDFEQFLSLNPWAANTLQTKGARGGNIWIRLSGGPCNTKKLKTVDEAAWGELRAGRSVTVVYGMHPSGVRYRRLTEHSPVEITMEDIVFPEGVEGASLPSSRSSERCVSIPSTPCTSIQQLQCSDTEGRPPKNKVAASIEAQCRFDQKHPELVKLYEALVRSRIPHPEKSTRNDYLCKLVPILFGACGDKMAIEFSAQFWSENMHVFRDPLPQHLKETRSLLDGCDTSFVSRLSPQDREVFFTLDAAKREAFRICYHLALLESDNAPPPPQFFLGCNELGRRIGMESMQAHRILRFFEKFGIISTQEKGLRWKAGSKPKASLYEWRCGLCAQGTK